MKPILLALLLTYIVNISVVNGVTENTVINVNHHVTEFDRFGFRLNGTIEMDSSYEARGPLFAMVLGCTPNEYAGVVSLVNGGSPSQLCNLPVCLVSIRLPRNDTFFTVINYATELRFLAVSCGNNGNGDSIPLEYTFLNPNGEHLADGDIPLPSIYMGGLIVTGMLTLAWLAALYAYRRVNLHWVILAVLLGETVICAIGYGYWSILSEYGHRTTIMDSGGSLLFALGETIGFALLLCVANGYNLTRSHLDRVDVRNTAVALILFLVTLVFFSVYNRGYYFLTLMVLYFFMLPKVFSALGINRRLLESQVLMFSQLDVHGGDAALAVNQTLVFQRLRMTAILFMCGSIFVAGSKMFLGSELAYSAEASGLVVILVTMTLVAALLRPRSAHSTPLFPQPGQFLWDIMERFAADDDIHPERRLHMVIAARQRQVEAERYMSSVTVVQYPPLDVLSPSEAKLAIGLADSANDDMLKKA